MYPIAFNDFLLAEERRAYLENLSDAKKECVFCATVPALTRTPGQVGTVYVIAVFEHTFVVVNPYPYVPKGHVMIVTKRHIADYRDLTDEEITEIFHTVLPRVQAALTKEYIKITGFNIGMNIGDFAGRSIEHLHVHVVPRMKNEAGFMEATAGTRVMSESAEQTMQRIAKHFGA